MNLLHLMKSYTTDAANRATIHVYLQRKSRMGVLLGRAQKFSKFKRSLPFCLWRICTMAIWSPQFVSTRDAYWKTPKIRKNLFLQRHRWNFSRILSTFKIQTLFFAHMRHKIMGKYPPKYGPVLKRETHSFLFCSIIIWQLSFLLLGFYYTVCSSGSCHLSGLDQKCFLIYSCGYFLIRWGCHK